jgi:hypothetical protein
MLLGNGAVNVSSTIKDVFSTRSVPRSYFEDNWRYNAVEDSVVEC